MCLQRRSVQQITAAVEKVIPSDEFDVFYNDVELPTVKCLPDRYVFKSSSLTVDVRSATKDDMPRLYALMKSVADTGHGYGIDEFPTLNAFREMTRDVYIIVVEEQSSTKVRNYASTKTTVTRGQLHDKLTCCNVHS